VAHPFHVSHLHRDWAHPCHVPQLHRDGAHATCHTLHRDWAHPCHVPHLHRDWAHLLVLRARVECSTADRRLDGLGHSGL
jgi:hypothetical protein